MNRSRIIVVVCAAGLLSGSIIYYYLSHRISFDERKPAVGETAPVIALADLSGRMVRLADYHGKVVLVNFWAGWCPPCKDELPGFQKVLLALEERGFMVLGVAINEVTPADLMGMNILFPVMVANDRVKREYGDISFPPVSFLVGKDGRILKKIKGVYPEDELRKDVDAALAAKG